MESKELAIALARALDAKKARDIRVIRVHDLTTVTDYFVIATGTSTTHVGALADEADFQLGRQGVNVLRTELDPFGLRQRHRPCLYPGSP